MTYMEYLEQLHKRASAAYRKRMRQNPEPCSMCGSHDSEVTPEGLWLCRHHKVQFQNMQKKFTVFEKLQRLGVEYPTEEDFNAGNVKIKKVNRTYKVPWKVAYRTVINYIEIGPSVKPTRGKK